MDDFTHILVSFIAEMLILCRFKYYGKSLSFLGLVAEDKSEKFPTSYTFNDYFFILLIISDECKDGSSWFNGLTSLRLRCSLSKAGDASFFYIICSLFG